MKKFHFLAVCFFLICALYVITGCGSSSGDNGVSPTPNSLSFSTIVSASGGAGGAIGFSASQKDKTAANHKASYINQLSERQLMFSVIPMKSGVDQVPLATGYFSSISNDGSSILGSATFSQPSADPVQYKILVSPINNLSSTVLMGVKDVTPTNGGFANFSIDPMETAKAMVYQNWARTAYVSSIQNFEANIAQNQVAAQKIVDVSQQIEKNLENTSLVSSVNLGTDPTIQQLASAAALAVPSGVAQLSATASVLLGITLSPNVTTISGGSSLSLTNIGVVAVRSDLSKTRIYSGFAWTGSGVSGTTFTAPVGSATYILTCSYTENGITKTASLVITVTGSSQAKVLSGISLFPTSATVGAGGVYNLATVGVIATYSDSSIATLTTGLSWSGTGVSGPTFTAPISSGTYVLTCSYTEGGITKTATFNVTVLLRALSGISLTPATATVAIGGTYNLGNIAVVASYSDSSLATLTTGLVWNGTGVSVTTFTAPTASGPITITTSYTENGVTKTTSFVVTIASKALTGISFIPASASVILGSSYNLGQVGVIASYSDSTSASISSGLTWSGTGVSSSTFTPTATGSYSLNCSYSENGLTQAASFPVTVIGKSLSGISLFPASAIIASGTSYNLGNVGVLAFYNNSTTASVTNGLIWSGTGISSTTFSAPPASTPYSLICTYAENGATMTATFTMTVTKALSGLSLSPASASVAVGQTYNLGNVSVIASYTDATNASVTTGLSWSGTGVASNTFTAPTATGPYSLICSYTELGISQTATFTATVTP
ncbi:MAG: hypothetical protein HQM08_17800 [Candidatus Riflebacteria bacterium]|nr:hypothetical protein [Candidatus Riflebacteria bacterium]